MSLDLDLGVDLTIGDDASSEAAPTATDTGFLIHSIAASGSPTGVQQLTSVGRARAVYPNEMAVLAAADAFFNVGGARLYVIPLGADAAAATALITPEMGPGQITAPEVVASVDQAVLRDFAWESNRIYFADAPDGADAAAVEVLAAALVSANGRNSAIWGDTLLIPGIAPGSTREVAASVVAAALAARSDINTGNPNLAAAGNHTPGAAGQADYVLGIKAPRPLAEIKSLATNQVNSFRVVNNRVRNYGWWTLADLDALPNWWDVSGSRTMMAIRAEENAAAEEMMFGQIDGTGTFQDKYQGALSGVLSRYQRIGAIFGNEQNPGYRVLVSSTLNPTSRLAVGKVSAEIHVKTSPFAGELDLTIVRRAITDSVA